MANELEKPFLFNNEKQDGEVAGFAGRGHYNIEMDNHFRSLYSYFYRKGLVSIVLSESTAIANLAVIIALTTVVLSMDWKNLFLCTSEGSCKPSIRDYLMELYKFSAFYRFLVLSYVFLAMCYFFRRSFSAVAAITNAFTMKEFYAYSLCITDESLPCLTWSTVLDRVINLHKLGKCLMGHEAIDELEITGRIMRSDNYLISMINQEILDIRVPVYFSLFLPHKKVNLTESLKFCIRYCLLDNLFNANCAIRGGFLKNEDDLKRRFISAGIINFALMPFLVFHMVAQFFLEHAQANKEKKTSFFDREWSPLAKLHFRELNELPHHFDERMRAASFPADEYLRLHDSLRNRNLRIVVRSIGFISGSIVAVLILLSALREESLLYIHVGAHNLLWWLTLFTTIFLGCHGFTQNQSDYDGVQNENLDPRSSFDLLANRVSSHTHYYSPYLRQHPPSLEQHQQCRDELETLFPQKWVIFGYEVLAAVLTPVILCFSLPKCTARILSFVRDHTCQASHGAVVDSSLFPLEDLQRSQRREQEYGDGKTTRHGKLEASYMTFRASNPNWREKDIQAHHLSRGQHLIGRIAAFRETKEREKSSVHDSAADLTFTQNLLSSSSRYFSHAGQLTASSFHPSALPPAGPSDLRSVLVSLLRAENIDYENDFYWLNEFQKTLLEDRET